MPEEDQNSNTVRFVSGALDGVTGHHFSQPDSLTLSSRAALLVDLLETLVAKPTGESLKNIYEVVIAEPVLPVADEFQKLAASRLLPRYKVRLAETGRFLITRADRHEAVKFGVLLLGLVGDESDIPLLKTLGSHDEFTLYAAVALCNLVDETEQCLWDVARSVRGWGRVQAVERLAETQRPEIQAWLLREGFRNEIMNEYLAAICARAGKLHEALRPSTIDRELLDSTAELLSALVSESGPADDIDDYEHAPEVLNSYLRHVTQIQPAGLAHLITTGGILDFLDGEGWEERFSRGWTGDLRDSLAIQCRSVMSWPFWRHHIDVELNSDDAATRGRATWAAQMVGMDTWDVQFDHVRKSPLDHSAPWFELLRQTNEERIDEVLAYALSVLPMDSLVTGPADLMGLGPGFEAEHVLDFLLQELKRFPGRGWEFIRAGLQNRVVRSRNMALNALESWPREGWPAEAFSLLQHAYANEPCEDVRGRISAAIKVR